MFGIDQDIARLAWYNTGLSADELRRFYRPAEQPLSTEQITAACRQAIDNLEQFYHRWSDYFDKYRQALEQYGQIDTGEIQKVDKYWGEGIRIFIDTSRDLLTNPTKVNTLLTNTALFRAQTIPKWYFGVHCKMYDALAIHNGLNAGRVIEDHRNTCLTAVEVNNDTLFSPIPPIDSEPPLVDIEADIAKLKALMPDATPIAPAATPIAPTAPTAPDATPIAPTAPDATPIAPTAPAATRYFNWIRSLSLQTILIISTIIVFLILIIVMFVLLFHKK